MEEKAGALEAERAALEERTRGRRQSLGESREDLKSALRRAGGPSGPREKFTPPLVCVTCRTLCSSPEKLADAAFSGFRRSRRKAAKARCRSFVPIGVELPPAKFAVRLRRLDVWI